MVSASLFLSLSRSLSLSPLSLSPISLYPLSLSLLSLSLFAAVGWLPAALLLCCRTLSFSVYLSLSPHFSRCGEASPS